MSFPQVIRRNWVLVLVGSVLYITGIGMLFWNEARAVKNTLSLDEALNDVVMIRPSDLFDPKLNGRVVHLTGPLVTGEPLTEPDYGIQVLAVRLRRRVQMLQWVEESVEYKYGASLDVAETAGGERTYYYRTEWMDTIVDTSGFYMRHGHENPNSFPIETRIQVADHVNIGYYELGNEVKSRIKPFVDLTSDSRPDDPSLKLHSGFYYHSNDVWNPEVGDIRILFSFAGLEGSIYTVVGQVRDGKIVPYISRFDVPILLVYDGEHSPGRAAKNAQHSFRIKTWSIRGIGWLLLFFAVTCTSSIISATFANMPLLWTLAPDPRQPVSGNLLLTISLALTITSFAWIVQRPWVGLSMIAAAISPFVMFAGSMVRYQRLSAS